MLAPAVALSSTLLILGDSLSAGYGIELEQGWTHLLQQKLDHNKDLLGQWQVVNASVSGETTAGAQARLPDLLQQYQPQVCVIALGANDGLRGMQVSLIEERLSMLITQCQQMARVILVQMRLPPNYGPHYVEAFANAYGTVAKNHQVALTPFMLEGFAQDMKYFQQDGLHPTSEAQTKVLHNIWPTLSELLRGMHSQIGRK